jgi:chromosome segregation ATPase
MMMRAVTAAGCVALGSSVDLSVNVKSSLSTLTLDTSSKNRPVAKVINVLNDMLKQLEKEASEDEELYETMTCWCETNDREKTKAISDAEAKIDDLGVKIEELTAKSGKLGVEIKNLEKEVAKNQAALDKATEIRMKELSEFNDEEKDLLGSISALKSALEVLGKHNGASMLQLPNQHLAVLAKSVNTAMTKHQDMLTGVFTKTEKKAVAAFIQNAAQPSSDGSYAPASGQIFGILEQMKETFETNLSDSQKMEMGKQNAYDQVKAAKNAEIQAGQNQIDKKTEELAHTDEANAAAKQDLKDTKATLSEDEKFLMMLKELCAKVDAQYEARTKERNMEMEACSKALAVLTSDEAHDMFTKTFNFLQTSKSGARRADASAVLKKVAAKTHNQALSALATKVRLDAFEKVKKAIADMIAALQQEKADEIKHKDFCVEEFNQNQLATEKKTRQKNDLDASIDDLNMSIKQLTSDLDNLKAQIAEMKTQMKRAGEDREKENKEFQMTVADQRATQKLLQAALEILKGFYDKKNTTFDKVLLQTSKQSPPPMTGFKDYSKNKQAGGVQGMIQTIIDDAKAMENEAIVAEEDAQKGYENFVKDSNASIEDKTKEIVEKTEEKAKANENLVEDTESKDNAVQELADLSEANGELHASCDFVMKNFEIRQSSRDEEIQALQQATAILSGAKLEDA